jgi:hypothetical protein
MNAPKIIVFKVVGSNNGEKNEVKNISYSEDNFLGTKVINEPLIFFKLSFPHENMLLGVINYFQ